MKGWDWLGQLLKLPPAPESPAGSAGSVRIFQAARGYYSYRLLQWGGKQASAAVGIGFGLLFLTTIGPQFLRWGSFFGLPGIVGLLEILGIGFYLFQLGASFLLLKLDYQCRWYLVTDRSLRIREGILRVREQTMSFANIQNISVRQGPLQRLFGIADLEVRTAGGGEKPKKGENESSKGADLHRGNFRGVDNAAEIREVILRRLRRLQDGGLGDPDDPELPSAGTPARPESVLEAAREALEAARSLRKVVEGSGP